MDKLSGSGVGEVGGGLEKCMVCGGRCGWVGGGVGNFVKIDAFPV